MSRGRKRVIARVSDTLFADVVALAHRRGVDLSDIVRTALLAYLQPRKLPAREQPQATPQSMSTALLQALDPATRAQLTEAMARFQGSAAELVRIIVRQWAVSMRDPRAWRVWRP